MSTSGYSPPFLPEVEVIVVIHLLLLLTCEVPIRSFRCQTSLVVGLEWIAKEKRIQDRSSSCLLWPMRLELLLPLCIPAGSSSFGNVLVPPDC